MKYLKTVFLIFALLSFIPLSAGERQPVDYVNSMIGTAIRNQGGLAPFTGPPFAMTNFLPQTRENKMSTMAYVYDDTHIMGFLASHQPTVWMGDYGYVSVMPQTGKLRVLPDERKLPFSHDDEKASPYCYSVKLGGRAPIGAEMTSTSRCAIMRFSFPDGEARIIVQGINLNKALSDWCNDYESRLKTCRGWIKVDTAANEIIGYNPDRQSAQLGPDLPNFKGYFVIKFDAPIRNWGVWNNDEIHEKQSELEGTRMGAFAEFLTKDRNLTLKVATSFVSIEQARMNLENEIPDWDFEKVSDRTRAEWNAKLSKMIPGKDVSDEDKTVFYSSLYHCYLFPREFSEYGKYYSAFDDSIHEGISYNDFSLWDTFRAYHPLMTLLEPELTGNWITSLLQMYREGGWMPIWPNPSYTNIMIGTHADAVIADAYMKGIRNYDVSLAYEAMRKNAMVPPDCDTKRTYGDRHRWQSFEGRAGASYYHSIGYVPFDKTAESVSRTLEYAFDDWCISRVAKELGMTEDYARLKAWSGNYRNVYNPETGFMAPRLYSGEFAGGEYADHGMTEGSKWTYLFCVLQDIPGMIEMMGGDEAFAEKLDRNFSENHYRHDNEPGHHYIYLYDYCGYPWKTQELVRKAVREYYRNSPDGLIGNDDCGQMSAWYIFSTLGFYPVTPASNTFAIGAPQFPEITVELTTPQGQIRNLRIIAENISEENKYIESAYIDGIRLSEPFISYGQLVNASEIRFVMTGSPADFGTDRQDTTPVVNVSLDSDRRYQTMDNFGASDCWTFQFLGENWPVRTKNRIADLLFSTEMDEDGNPEGIGLSLWRFNIGAGSADNPRNVIANRWRSTECLADSTGKYDFTGKQQGQIWFLKAAKERGCTEFLGFCNSAPWYMTKNRQACNVGGLPDSYNLAPERYHEFAGFLSDVWHGLKKYHGIELDYISPINEPEWDWRGTGQEGSPASISEISSFVRCLDGVFGERNVDAVIVFPEVGAYEHLYAPEISKTAAFFDRSSPYYLGDLSHVRPLVLGHSYWSSHNEVLEDVRARLRRETEKYGVRLWQSEYCIMSNDGEVGGGGYRDMTMKTALYVSRIIHHDIVTAGATSWQWWTAVSPENYKDGLLFVDKDIKGTSNVYVPKLLWAFGNYSRFVRPGAVRIEAESDDKDILTSAYRNEDGSEVVVIQNHRDSPVSLDISSDVVYTGYLTSDAAEDNLRCIGDVTSGTVIPARSIITLVKK